MTDLQMIQIAKFMKKKGWFLQKGSIVGLHILDKDRLVKEPWEDWNDWRELEKEVMRDEKMAKSYLVSLEDEIGMSMFKSWSYLMVIAFTKAKLPKRVDALTSILPTK